MLNRKFRDNAIEEYNQSEEAYQAAKIRLLDVTEQLYKERTRLEKVITSNQDVVTELKHKTQEMERELEAIARAHEKYNRFLQEVEAEVSANESFKKLENNVLMAGALTFRMTATTATAMATTFRTAATGGGIAGGVFAANASMAWLGGQAFMAAGGGMVFGGGLLGLMTPIGWTVLLAAGVFQNGKNKKLGREALEKAEALQKETVALKGNEAEVRALAKLTKQQRKGLGALLYDIKPQLEAHNWDMRHVHQDDALLEQVGVQINMLQSASQLLNQKVGDSK